jgi:hypothetical protein
MKNIFRPMKMYIALRHKHYLHKPTANLYCFQKSAYYAEIKFFNNLPSDLKSLMHESARFKMELKRCLNTHSFYSVDEYLLPKKLLIRLKVVYMVYTSILKNSICMRYLCQNSLK